MSSPAFGAYLQCYKNPLATYICLQSFRKHYPTSTIVLLSDNGYDYSEMAKHFQCIYLHETETVLLTCRDKEIKSGLYKDNTHRLIDRLSLCFELCPEDYVMWLEDDVHIHGPVDSDFAYDMNGWCPNTFQPFTIKALAGTYTFLDTTKPYRFTGQGGSIFHKKRFLQYINNREIVDDVLDKWNHYCGYELGQDLFFSLLATLGKGTIGPYSGHGEFHSCSNMTVRHQYKIHYGKPLPQDLQYLVKEI